MPWINSNCYIFWVCDGTFNFKHAKDLPNINFWYLWPVWPYHFLPHLIKGMIFGNTIVEYKCLFWFSPHPLPETFLILRRVKQVIVFVYSTCYSCQISTTREFSCQTFEKCRKIKFHKNPSSESRVFSIRTDRLRGGRTWRTW